jgi:hypothetical protein
VDRKLLGKFFLFYFFPSILLLLCKCWYANVECRLDMDYKAVATSSVAYEEPKSVWEMFGEES